MSLKTRFFLVLLFLFSTLSVTQTAFSAADGVYTIQQKSSNRYVDAYEDDRDNRDYRLVTRTRQYNVKQRWVLKSARDTTFSIQHLPSGRYVDAYEDDRDNRDYRLVTRPQQNNDTQIWILKLDNGFTIQQKSSNRYVDAYENDREGRDYGLVTRLRQNNDSQIWVLEPTHLDNNSFTFRQKSMSRSGSPERYVDAYENDKDDRDYRLVNRRWQASHHSQIWVLTGLGNSTYTIQQKSTGRYMDAYEKSRDYRLVTRPRQDNDTQRWVLKPAISR